MREAVQAPVERPAPPGAELTREEHDEAERRSALRPDVVHAAIQMEGEDELVRPSSALAWSGLAAGSFSMGFSLVAEGLLASRLPDAPWRPLLSKFGYCVGYLIVILGRQQLFTENTLTVILPLLVRKDRATLLQVSRVWVVVLLANLAGALLFVSLIAHARVFALPMQTAFAEVSRQALAGDPLAHLVKGVFAGWLIALMVWLLPAAETGPVSVIMIITYLVGLGGFTHIIAGSVESFYLVTTGELAWDRYLSGYALPTLVGNCIGGVALVASLNHAQVVAGRET